MKFFNGFFLAFTACFSSLTVIFKKGLWPFLIYPLIIWLISWLLTLWGIALLSDVVAGYVTAWLDAGSIPDEGHWLSPVKAFLQSDAFKLLLGWTIRLLLFFVSGTLSKYVLLIVLSPLFALLSERAEEAVTGKKFPFSAGQFLKDIFRGVVISLRNMLFEYLFIAASSLMSLFFPPAILITAPFLLLVSWYYTGFTLMDYSFERHRMGIAGSVAFARAHKGSLCGIGCAYWLWTLLPGFPGGVAGVMFGPASGVTGATITFLRIKTA